MERLASQFMQRLPTGIKYAKVKLLCFRLFLTADGIPKVFHPQLARQGLANMFAELARAGWIHHARETLPIIEGSYWDGVITSWLLKKNPDIAEFSRGPELVKSFGFYCETASA